MGLHLFLFFWIFLHLKSDFHQQNQLKASQEDFIPWFMQFCHLSRWHLVAEWTIAAFSFIQVFDKRSPEPGGWKSPSYNNASLFALRLSKCQMCGARRQRARTLLSSSQLFYFFMFYFADFQPSVPLAQPPCFGPGVTAWDTVEPLTICCCLHFFWYTVIRASST